MSKRLGEAEALWERRVRRELFGLAPTPSRCTQRSYTSTHPFVGAGSTGD